MKCCCYRRTLFITAFFLCFTLLNQLEAFAQPANDQCSNAIALTSSTTCVNTAGTNLNATYNPASLPDAQLGCGSRDKADVWYTFVAVSSTHTITVSSAPSQVRVQLFSGTCGSFTSIACNNSTITATGLTVGNTYYIRVYTQNPSTGSFNICVTHSAPANDNCSAAVSLTSNSTCSNTAGSLNFATASAGIPAGCQPVGTHYDVWYSFVAVTSTETITISSLGANITNPRIQLYSGTCAGLTSVACGTTSITQAGLTIGNTYYVRVANLGTDPTGAGTAANFNICVTHTPPANDDCANAIALTSNSSCVNTAGTLNGASYSTISSIGCGTASRNDVWYTFVAQSTNTTITLSSAPSNPRIQLFTGSCGALTSVACASATSLASTTLIPGTTYYVRIYTDPNTSGSATFNICVTHAAPANNECASAITLTSNTSCVNTTGSLNYATANGATVLGCQAAGTYYDVWYSFVALATSHTVTLSNLGSNITNPVLQMYTGACAALGGSVCGTTTITQTGLTVGTTYKIRVSNMTTDPTGAGNVANFDICITHTATYDQCAGAIPISSYTGSCGGTTAGTTTGQTYTASSITTNCNGNTAPDVWYTFVAQSPNPTLTAISTSSNNRIQVEVYSGSCGGLVCVSGSNGNNVTKNLTPTGLTIGQTYYVRITTSNGSTTDFTLCIVDPAVASPPANDDCSGATTITPGAAGASCSNTGGTFAGSTASSPVVASSCSGSPGADVWYVFTATSPFNTISLSSIGSNISANTTYLELYSGACGTLTSLQCTSGTGTTLSMSPTGTGLTVGNTYYIRIHTGNTYTGGATNWGFNICITTPGTGTSATIDYSKSYINVTKLATGGSVEPGDILEIRATFVVRSGTVDSLAFFDTLKANKGYQLLSSTIATQTNEGKIYRAFTDAYDSDAGWYTVNGSDTIVRINLGPTASATARGSLSSSSRPSVYGSTCIIMATYRVQVYATYDQKINWGGGAFTYRDGSNGMRLASFKNDSLVVYVSPGLCSSALSTNNQVGLETNGTFGAPSGSTPWARNRGTSTAVPSYTYAQFSTPGAPTSGGGPNDYYYGIANNTSATYTTSSVYNKSTLGSSIPQRVFSHWDIIGDHTGATDPARGNPPCDINQPISATNPCGYMLVVNAAYKTDTAFRSTVTNLCPNTYYEISAWVRNICYKCGCDSTGKGAANANAATAPAYIPFATNDSSGVPPNLAFQIDGQDYYSTGNIYYTGTGAGITQSGSDTVNTWVKRGFVYKTGLNQTSFEFVIRNNAPGGGGNDWAIDDIVVASCLPIMTYSPSLLPTVCDSNTLRIYDTVRSSYENYTYYKWQRSTDGGANWVDVTANLGPATPFWNGSAWEYTVYYDIPASNTTAADSADLYRMIVATTSSNLSSPSCQATDVVSIITLNVIDCGIALKTDILSFSGKLVNEYANLAWSTSAENEPVHFDVERSLDGTSFTRIATVDGLNNPRSTINYYSLVDPQKVSGKVWYRVVMVNKNARSKHSRIIQLYNMHNQFELVNVINPFSNELQFDLSIPADGKVDVVLMDMVGKITREKSYSVYTGMNSLRIENTGNLPSGVYILQIRNKESTITRKVMKK